MSTFWFPLFKLCWSTSTKWETESTKWVTKQQSGSTNQQSGSTNQQVGRPRINQGGRANYMEPARSKSIQIWKFPFGKETHNDKHNWIKNYMFCVIIYSAIDQGYMGPSLASCHKDEIWDLCEGISGLWSQEPSPKFGTSLRALLFVIWIFSFSRPNFPKPKPRLFSKTKFFRNRDFFQKPNFLKPKPRLFPRPNFSETKTETFFPRPNFPKPKLKPSKNWQKFQNREVLKPKCQSLAIRLWYDIMWYGYEPMKKLHFIIPSHNWI